ncbi:glycoside hydrolase family 27 protein [Schleiferilactobacillus harbinensis]|uniref:glycoside hydrolase family 27 protein n=1 Tax=Schleiferilactobacillus harbinensis TaxID=304207 RepID=UPI001171516D|nr:glycoside hydrolase family 27 protein [Schleiferilactobacillus harbinensis]GEK06443.1 alpha-galactosidase [Schleiferilactobacillus harbinensis]
MAEKAFRTWAPTAPMGWNSWDCFGASVTEAEVKANADYLANHLKQSGYEYVVVDIQWYEPHADSSVYHAFADLAMDDRGRLVPAANRFPSAANGQGFGPLAQYVHDLGLKFGIHIMRGIPRQAVAQNVTTAGGYHAGDIAANNICPWNSDMYGLDMTKPGAQEYYDSLLALYASWGVDFIKCDDIAESTLYGMHRAEIHALRQAIDKTGREIVLSLSPGPANINYGYFLQENANMWRLTDDFWDTWRQLKGMFPVAAKWAPMVRPGTWPDLDMLPLGAIRQRSVDGGTKLPHTRFTTDEQKTMLTLWALLRAPFFLGGDLPQTGDELSLITNQAVLAMRQEITDAHEEQATDMIVSWQAQSAVHRYFAFFNISDEDQQVSAPTEQCTELWQGTRLDPSRDITVPAHGVVLLRV